VRHGRIQRAYLGIGSQITRLPDALSEKAGGRPSGLLVLGVEADSPAGAAGLLVGDILVAIEGDPVGDTEELRAALGPDRVGATVRLDILRGGEPAEVQATLVERE
jgi:S1-C subfamily serine protease